MRMGSGYIGADAVKSTSATNTEIVPDAPANWTQKKYTFYRFFFHNFHECTIKINDSAPIKLLAEQGFEIDEIDAPVFSFVVLESGIDYQWIGHY